MQQLVTGIDVAGRSCVVDRSLLVLEVDPDNPGFASALVGATDAVPPSPRPAGVGAFVDLGVAPGLVRWLLVDYPPAVDFPMHHSDTIDFDLVLDGRLVLVLDDGEHELLRGDIVVVNGVDHGWKTGPDGARLSVCSVGTPPREEEPASFTSP